MGIHDIFSKRNKPVPPQDVLTYDALPVKLRIQIMHIWTHALGIGNDGMSYQPGFSEQLWGLMTHAVAREHGVVELVPHRKGYESACTYLVNTDPPVEEALDLIELTFRAIDRNVRDYWEYNVRRDAAIDEHPDDAIAELNHRFLEHGIGYQYDSGHIIKVDSTFTHATIVKPALVLLADRTFANAQQEYLQAHEAYRHGDYPKCLVEALKSFESTMKIICDENGWAYNQNDTASKLIGVVISRGLLSGSLQSQLTALRSLLESGTPTVRNKLGGHGQGSTVVNVPDYIAAYALHTAAANIVLLVSAHEAHNAGGP